MNYYSGKILNGVGQAAEFVGDTIPNFVTGMDEYQRFDLAVNTAFVGDDMIAGTLGLIAKGGRGLKWLSGVDDIPAPKNLPARLPAGANNATVRLTQAGDEFLHYGYAEHAAGWKAGARPGTYAGTIEATSGANAQNLYNLPRWRSPPDSVYRITPPAGTPIQGPGRVMPAYGRDIQGLGTEFIFPQGTPVGSVSGPFPIRPR